MPMTSDQLQRAKEIITQALRVAYGGSSVPTDKHNFIAVGKMLDSQDICLCDFESTTESNRCTPVHSLSNGE
jgi:hypothetical protein